MVANYLSAVYDLTPFGIYKIKNAILCTDIDDDITVEVSFDGGASFYPVAKPNMKFAVPTKSNGKIQVRITFEDVNTRDIYKVKATGFFSNLEIGTPVNFTKLTTNATYSVNLGRNGFYSISLPRGTYDVWYQSGAERQILMSNFNPETSYVPPVRIDKESIIEQTFRDLDWAKYSVFDTFEDRSKMIHGSAIVDVEGDLSDGATSRKCRYWAIGFD